MAQVTPLVALWLREQLHLSANGRLIGVSVQREEEGGAATLESQLTMTCNDKNLGLRGTQGK